jgi:hypothetical protein
MVQNQTKEWQIEAKPTCHLFWMENQLVQPTKNKLKALIWRTKNEALGTQGFNLLQISPNWFLGNWTWDLCLKLGLSRPTSTYVMGGLYVNHFKWKSKVL